MQIIINISVILLVGGQPHNQFKIVPSSSPECLENQRNHLFYSLYIIFW